MRDILEILAWGMVVIEVFYFAPRRTKALKALLAQRQAVIDKLTWQLKVYQKNTDRWKAG